MEAGYSVPEQERSRFTVVYLKDNKAEIVEIHEIEMNGWMLYKCFVLPFKRVYYFGWEHNAELPEWIDMENERESDDAALLCVELLRYKRPAA